jgi:hypothetical protein
VSDDLPAVVRFLGMAFGHAIVAAVLFGLWSLLGADALVGLLVGGYVGVAAIAGLCAFVGLLVWTDRRPGRP